MRNFIIAAAAFIALFIAYAFTHSLIKTERHGGIKIERQTQALSDLSICNDGQCLLRKR